MKKSIWLNFAFALFLIGAILLIVYCILLISSDSFSICKGAFDFGFSGQVGDFIGGVIGTFWGASGIILIYENYSLQKEEFQKTQNLVNIQITQTNIFKLVEELNRYVENINIKISTLQNNNFYKGAEFFKFIVKHIKTQVPFKDNEGVRKVLEQLTKKGVIKTNTHIESYIYFIRDELNKNLEIQFVITKHLTNIRVILLALSIISTTTGESKKSFIVLLDYLRQQLSSEEQLILYYFSLLEKNDEYGLFILLKDIGFFNEEFKKFLFEEEHIKEYFPRA
jgi:hypothetical protein